MIIFPGTIGPEVNEVVTENQATFYRVACEGDTLPKVTQEVANVSVSNGLAWSADGAIMYYVDSPTRKIDAFDFEAVNGTISKLFLHFTFKHKIMRNEI